jgi:hypothetical protein
MVDATLARHLLPGTRESILLRSGHRVNFSGEHVVPAPNIESRYGSKNEVPHTSKILSNELCTITTLYGQGDRAGPGPSNRLRDGRSPRARNCSMGSIGVAVLSCSMHAPCLHCNSVPATHPLCVVALVPCIWRAYERHPPGHLGVFDPHQLVKLSFEDRQP